MPDYAIESIRQVMTGTGIVDRLMEWEEVDGKRRPSKDKQARDENTGMPLWAVEVLYIQTSFGQKSTVSAKVTVGHEEEPKVAPMTPVGFTGLRVDLRIHKNGGYVEYWSADGLLESSKTTGTATSSASSTSRPASGEGKAA